MNVALPLTAFLAVVVALLIRSRELKIWHVVLVGVFGFFLAQTHLADPIGDAVRWLVTGLTHSGDPSAPSTPTAPPTTPPPWQWNA